MFYENTILAVRSEFPGIASAESKKAEEVPNLLWMCDQIESWDENSLDKALKAGRWIGWVLRDIELMADIDWDNMRSRELVRLDVSLGLDGPAYMRGKGLLYLSRRIAHLVDLFNKYLKKVYD